MYLLAILIAVFCACLIMYTVKNSNFDDVEKTPFAIIVIALILSSTYIYFNAPMFDEISTNKYELIIDTKEKCIKLPSCEKVLKEILEDNKIQKFELDKLEKVLNDEVKRNKEYEDWKKENEREQKNKEQLEKIKKELNTIK